MKEFITEIKQRGLARTNRYRVVIDLPSNDTNTKRLLTTFCETASLPSVSLSTSPVSIYTERREMPYERVYDTLTLSFYVDSSLKIKSVFDDWMDRIVNPSNLTIGYYKDYVRPIYIYVENVDESSPYVVTINEAYPKSMSAVQLDASAKDIMKLSVTFQYRNWASFNTTVPPKTFTTITPASDPISVTTGSGNLDIGLTQLQVEYGINPDGSSDNGNDYE